MAALKRFLPITVIIILIIIAYLTGLTRYLTWNNFEMVHRAAMDYVEKHPYTSPLILTGIYIIYASLAFPGILHLDNFGWLYLPTASKYTLCDLFCYIWRFYSFLINEKGFGKFSK